MTSKSVRTRDSDSNSITQYAGISISSVVVTDASYIELDDTAVSTSGGYVKIKGYGFVPECKVYFNNALVSNTYISSVEYRAVIPATAVGSYPLMIFDSRLNSGVIYANLQTSGFPTFTTTSYTSGTVTVSIQLLASGDAPLTYSLYSGTLPTGLSLSSSGLISGTTSGTSTTTFDVLLTDGQNQTTQQTITLIISGSDDYWKNTTLLLSGEALASNNSNANSTTIFSDTSDNRFTVTVNGDCRPSHFTPFTSNTAIDGSTFFDGTGDYLQVADSAALRFGTGDFTVEGWFYATSVSGQRGLVAKGGTAQTTGWEIRINGAAGGALAATISSTVVSGTTVIAVNTWYHFALTRSGTTVRLFLNGTQEGSGTFSTDLNQTDILVIGNTRPLNQLFLGYISNVRVSKQALYTSTFTPSTSRITTTSQSANSANVLLLTCQTLTSNNNSLFIDASINERALTKVGTPNFSSFNPFVPNWSVYFSGGDTLITQSNVGFALGTGDFTVECWFYPIVTGGGLIDFRQSGAASQVKPTIYWAGSTLAYVVSNTSRISFSSGSITANQWYHIAAVRSSGVTKMYLNGVVNSTTYTDSNDYGSTAQDIILGQVGDNRSFASGYYNGYISNARVVKGQALYTANFSPSSTSLTTTSQGANSSNVTLLTCNNYGFIDKSNNALSLYTTAQVSVVNFSPFSSANTYTYDDNGTSMYLAPASGNYLTCTANNDFLPSASNFTIEAWVYPTTNAASRGISNNWQSGGACIFTLTSGNFLEFSFTDAASGISTKALTGTTRSVAANCWSHIAVVRNGNTGSLYVNGIADATTYNFTGVTIYNYNGVAKQFRIGVGGDLGGPYVGYISNYRFVNGTAVYTGNFTPSVRPFGYREYASTTKVLLSGATTSVLDSTMQNTLQLNGNVRLLPGTSKWGTHSYFFDGTGDYISVYAYARPALSCYFGTQDFTIEAWLYPTTVSKAMTVIDSRTSAASTTGLALSISATGFPLVVINNATLFTSSTALTINTWTHVAVVRYGTTVTLYLDGTKPTTGNGTSAASCTDRDVTIGTSVGNRDATATNHYQGYIDDLRVTRGYARYVANFTAPSSPNKGL